LLPSYVVGIFTGEKKTRSNSVKLFYALFNRKVLWMYQSYDLTECKQPLLFLRI